MPFLSIGDDIGHREVRYRGNSPLTGDFVVEDVTDGEDVYRRLVFLSGVVLVQSQSRLIKGDHEVPLHNFNLRSYDELSSVTIQPKGRVTHPNSR